MLLIVAGFCAAAASGHENAISTNWTIIQKTDPISDRVDTSAILSGSDGQTRLAIVCNGLDEQVLTIQFTAKQYLGSRRISVLARVNQGKAFGSTWEVQSKIAWTPDKDIIRQFGALLTAGEDNIVMRAIDFEDQPNDGIFVSRNGAEAFKQVAHACEPPAAGKRP